MNWREDKMLLTTRGGVKKIAHQGYCKFDCKHSNIGTVDAALDLYREEVARAVLTEAVESCQTTLVCTGGEFQPCRLHRMLAELEPASE